MPGPTELIIIALIIFVLFGAAAIPRFAKSIGEAKSEFDKGLKDGSKKDKEKNEKKSDS